MPVDWSNQEVRNRVLTAVLACHDGKLNYKMIANHVEHGCSESAAEHFLRDFRKAARELKASRESRADAAAAGAAAGPSSSSSAAVVPGPAVPKKAARAKAPKNPDAVRDGRVAKKDPPAKAGKGKVAANVKAEHEDAGDAGMGAGEDAGEHETAAGESGAVVGEAGASVGKEGDVVGGERRRGGKSS